MPFAIELFFEPSFDQEVRQVWAGVSAQAAVENWMARKGSRPHLALAVFEEGDLEGLLAVLKDLAAASKPFEVRLESFGSFAGQEGVLFLAPVVTRDLLAAHQACQARIQGLVKGSWAYYNVDRLVFHCTANMGLDPEGLGRALAAARTAALPIIGQVASIGLVEFPEVRFLGDVRLGGER
jgi:2'-5' RNA ligase